MGNQTDYFEKNAYQPEYAIGDRVFGHYQKIPFIGSVGNDRVVSESGPEVTVHLDLPIRHENKNYSIIVVKHQDIKRLTNYDDNSGLQRTTAKNRK